MRFVLGNYGFADAGGSETHLLTVAEHIQRLGHEALVYAHEVGPFSDHAGECGVDVATNLAELPSECDVVLAQDAVVAYELADRYPTAVQVFRACSDVYDFELPPQVADVVDMVLVVSDRYARLVRACAVTAPVTRLRSPIDLDRLTPRGRIRARPQRAVLLGNYPDRRELIKEVWGEAGIEVVELGRPHQTFDVAAALVDVDVVVGKSRAALDAMACGRAVYVYDKFGGDGWVTPATYAALEADNFAGQATDRVIGAEDLARDLADYDPRMGVANRDLVVQHHSARDHVIQLIDSVAAVRPGARPAIPGRELARLTALLWSWERRVRGLEDAQRSLREELARAQEWARQEAAAHASLREELVRTQERAQWAEAEVDAMRRTRAWRLAARFSRLAQRLRRFSS